MKHANWKARAKRMLKMFIAKCGGEFETGLLRTPGKLIRIDYVEQSMGQLARDLPTHDALFFRSLPVNVERWIRAMCTYDIATYVPREWSIRHTFPPGNLLRKGKTFTQILRFNSMPYCAPFFKHFDHACSMKGISVRLCESQQQYEAEMSSHGTRGVITSDESPRLSFACPSSNTRPLPSATFKLRPSTSLDVEETLGTLARQGRLLLSGTFCQILSIFVLENNGEAIRVYGATSSPSFLPPLSQFNLPGLWTASNDKITFLCDDKMRGCDVEIIFREGIHAEVITLTELTGGKIKTNSLAEKIVANIAEVEKKHMTLMKPELKQRKTDTDIIQKICQQLRRNHVPTHHAATTTATAIPQKLTAQTSEKCNENTVEAPRKNRNAWILSDDNRCLEVVDSIMRDDVMTRKRWLNGNACETCRKRHPDASRASETACRAKSCKNSFKFYSTTTHYIFANASRKRVERDINLPLFTDDVLMKLPI
ncbi:MAG: hypothetical protein QMC37_08460 [Flavobacteriales bacterium]